MIVELRTEATVLLLEEKIREDTETIYLSTVFKYTWRSFSVDEVKVFVSLDVIETLLLLGSVQK